MAWKMFAWDAKNGCNGTSGVWAEILGRKPPEERSKKGRKLAGKSPGRSGLNRVNRVGGSGRSCPIEVEDDLTSA